MRERALVAALAAFALAWLAFVATSALATQWPIVLADETVYMLSSLFGYRAGNFERWGIVQQIPNVLYYALYGLLPEAGFYASSKLLNAALVAAAALPAYLTARRHVPAREAAAFAAVTIATPVCTFARYFMPDCLFHFGFWCVTWLLLQPAGPRPIAFAAAAGAALGLLSLVKPHAFALVVGATALLVLRPARARGIAVATLLACFYACRAVVLRLLAGDWDLTLGGPGYGAVLSPSSLASGGVLWSALGHLCALALLAGLPLVALAAAVSRDLRSRSEADPGVDLSVLALAALAAATAMTVLFSAAVHQLDPASERITRLHGRYYAYVLPLTMLACLVAWRRGSVPAALQTRRALLAASGVAGLAGAVLAARFEIGIIDYPELAALLRWPYGAAVALAAALAGAVVTHAIGRLADRRAGVALAMAWWASIVVTTSVLALAAPLVATRFASGDIDRAMLEDVTLRGLRHRADGLVVGPGDRPADTYRVLFHLASLARGRLVPRGTEVDVAALPADVRWMIVLPGVVAAPASATQSRGPLTLVNRSPP